jgi:serine/threonine-protein kinase
MPPEQLRQGPVGPATDVYGLAVVLWEMLTGRRLFLGESDPIVLAQVLAGTVLPPRSLVPDLPPTLEAVVMRGLDRDVGRRYPSALAMAEALEALRLAASPRDVAAVVAARGAATLEAREHALHDIHHATSTPPRSPVPREEGGAPEPTLTGRREQVALQPDEAHIEPPAGQTEKPARQGRSRRLIVATAALGAMTCGALALALSTRSGSAGGTTASAVPAGALSATTPAPASSDTPTSPSASAPAAPSSAEAAAVPSPPPPKTQRPRPSLASDCAQNPRRLGPDGVYQVRRECLGR